MNNEAKACRKPKSEVLGTARVMSYEDLNKARADCAAKEAAKEAKKAAKEAKKAAFDSKLNAPSTKKKGGRKKKNVTIPGPFSLDPKVAQMGEKQVAENEQEVNEGGLGWIWEQDEILLSRQRAPIAQMW
jgi:hypothetical protein